MSGASSVLWRLFPAVRSRERGRFLFFLGLSVLISLAQTLGLVGSEALFLSRVGMARLPATFVLASALTVLGSLLYATWVGRLRNDSFFEGLLLGAAAILALVALAAGRQLPGTYTALFCVYFLFQAVFINHYWTFAWDYFDTPTSQRLFPLLAIGSSLGGFIGGGLALLLVRAVGPEALLWAWLAVLIAGASSLRLMRRRLRRWGPLDLEEADESSVEGMRGAIAYIRRSPLGQWLVISSGAMVMALFVSQYLYSRIFLESFPTAAALAIFLAVYLGVSNLVEVAVAAGLTPFLVRRLGVAWANLAHPALMLLSFAALALDARLILAIAARVNRELLDNSLAEPVRNLVYNALPFRFRGRIRAFLEGMVVYSGLALAGGVLLLLEGPASHLWLCGVGIATAAIYWLANLRVRREYLGALVDGLRTGRLDLASLGDVLGRWEIEQLAALWDGLLSGAATEPSQQDLALAPILAKRGLLDPLMRATAHRNSRVRRACIDALSESIAPGVGAVLLRAAEDADADVRAAATRALGARLIDGEGRVYPEAEAALRALTRDDSPEVRAEAALHLGGQGQEVLAQMTRSRERGVAVSALRRLPLELIDSALARADDPEAGLRAEVIECVTRLVTPVPLAESRLEADLNAADPLLRSAVIGALGTLPSLFAIEALARALGDPSSAVRARASQGLALKGEAGLRVVLPVLRSSDPHSVAAALDALEWLETRRLSALLTHELRGRVREAWSAVLALHALGEDGSPELRLLRAAYRDLGSRSVKIAFAILEHLEDPHVMRTVDRVLRFAPGRARGDALEVLSNLGDRETSRLLVLLLEEGPIEEKIPAVGGTLRVPSGPAAVIEGARDASDPWIRRGYIASRAARGSGSQEEESMERLLLVRRVPLFSQLTLDQLEAINRLLDEENYLDGEVIVEEGAVGDRLYVLVEGEVEIFRDYQSEERLLLNRQRPVSCLGEMAVLDGRPRSATIVAVSDVRLLRLEGARLKELVLQMPEIAFDFFRVLNDRVRSADQRLSENLRADVWPALEI